MIRSRKRRIKEVTDNAAYKFAKVEATLRSMEYSVKKLFHQLDDATRACELMRQSIIRNCEEDDKDQRAGYTSKSKSETSKAIVPYTGEAIKECRTGSIEVLHPDEIELCLDEPKPNFFQRLLLGLGKD